MDDSGRKSLRMTGPRPSNTHGGYRKLPPGDQNRPFSPGKSPPVAGQKRRFLPRAGLRRMGRIGPFGPVLGGDGFRHVQSDDRQLRRLDRPGPARREAVCRGAVTRLRRTWTGGRWQRGRHPNPCLGGRLGVGPWDLMHSQHARSPPVPAGSTSMLVHWLHGSVVVTVATLPFIRANIPGRILFESPLAPKCAKVVGAPLVFSRGGCALLRNLHAADRVLCHLGLPPFHCWF